MLPAIRSSLDGPSPGPRGATAGARRRRRRWFAAALVLFVLAALLAIAELLLRLAWTPPAGFEEVHRVPAFRQPEANTWEPLPNLVGHFREDRPQDLPPSAWFEPRVLEIRTNSLGLRGPDLGDVQPGERRVLFGGDSLTFGLGIAAEESFPMRTAALLSAPGAQVTACNAGVPGYGFVATCKRLRRLRDVTRAGVLVAAYFIGNDATDDIAQMTTAVVAGRHFTGHAGNLVRRSWRGRMGVRSRLWLWAELWLLEHVPEWSLVGDLTLEPGQLERTLALPPRRQTIAGLFLDAPADHCFQRGRPPAVATWLADLEVTLRTLRQDAGGRPLLVVLLPSQYHIDPPLRSRVLQELAMDPALLRAGAAQERVRLLCEALDIACLDATGALAAAGDPPAMYLSDKVHLSRRGSEIVAAAVAERLRSMLP